MRRSYPKFLMLWFVIAAYGVQTVVGGLGMTICFGEGHGGSAPSAPSACCSHADHTGQPTLVRVHTQDEQCPCADLSCTDDPSRLESTTGLSLPPAALAGVLAWDIANAEIPQQVMRCPKTSEIASRAAPDFVRTVVLLI